MGLLILGTTPDEEFQLLEAEGLDGSIQDMQFKYLRSIGGTGTLDDMLRQYEQGDIVSTPYPDWLHAYDATDPSYFTAAAGTIVSLDDIGTTGDVIATATISAYRWADGSGYGGSDGSDDHYPIGDITFLQSLSTRDTTIRVRFRATSFAAVRTLIAGTPKTGIGNIGRHEIFLHTSGTIRSQTFNASNVLIGNGVFGINGADAALSVDTDYEAEFRYHDDSVDYALYNGAGSLIYSETDTAYLTGPQTATLNGWYIGARLVNNEGSIVTPHLGRFYRVLIK
jgi:hypothetical protein